MTSREGALSRVSGGLLWPGTCLVLFLAAAGFLSVWSASYRSAEFGRGYYLDFYLRQLVWIAAGFAVFLALLIPRRKTLADASYWVYGICLLSLVAVIVFGRCVNGSKRWIVLGPLQVQPSEFMKLGLVLALAKCLSAWKGAARIRDFAAPLVLTAVPMALIVRQPDLGTALVMLPVLLAMLYAAGAPWKALASAVIVLACAAPFSYFFLLREYQVKRVDAFLSQGGHSDEQKIGEAYQLIQSKVAVGSGGALGKGWRKGEQNTLNFTPFRHTDFIFAVVGEEWGFAGAAGLLLLYLLVFSLSISVAWAAQSAYDRLVVVGVVSYLVFQVFVNTAMAVGLAPVTGLTLPFVSYGGSSMILSFASLGLVAGARRREDALRFARPSI